MSAKYFIGFAYEMREWKHEHGYIMHEFTAETDKAAFEYAGQRYPRQTWYLLDAEMKPICSFITGYISQRTRTAKQGAGN